MKKILIITIAIILVLTPTIAAVILHLLPDEAVHKPINIEGTLYDLNGTSYDFNKNNNSDLAKLISAMKSNASLVSLSKDDLLCDKEFSVKISSRKDAKYLTLYMSLDGSSYYSDEDGSVYLINQNDASSFINSQFAVSIYEKMYTPTLNTISNYTVIPKSSEYKYITLDGSFINGTNKVISDEIITYYASVTTKLQFSQDPYICNIKAYMNDTLIFEGGLDAFNEASIPKTVTLRYEIEVTWENNKDNQGFGHAHYNFIVKYSPAPTFTIERTSIEAGEFLVVKAKNIISSENVSFSFTGKFVTTPKFFKNGDYYYALLPIDMDLATGEYALAISCAETTKHININVTERNRSASATVYSLDTPHTQSDLDNMYALISSIGMNSSEDVFATKTFVNYETDHSNNFYFKLGFGRVRQFESGPDFNMLGIEFSAPLDIGIPVINDGIVCASGEDTILGKYIVVDHGCGLKSWYCNISEASFSVGDQIQKGEIIAKTGDSAFYNQAGFYLITTVLDVAVSPYAIYEENFVLPR